MSSHYEDMRKGVKGMIKSWEDWDKVFFPDRYGTEEDDTIEKPPHYTSGSMEAIDYMKDSMDHMMFMGYLEGAVKKYLHRYRYKGKPVEDLKKAKWYLDRLIKEMEGG